MSRPPFINPAVPMAAQGTAESIFASAALATSGAWTRSDIVNVERFRTITLFVDYDPDASSTAAYPAIVGLVSNSQEEPAAGDDEWYQIPVWDGSLTAGTLAGTLPTGADYTIAQDQGVALVYGLAIRLAASSAASNEYRQAIVIDVAPYKYFHFIVAEVGDTTNPGTFSALFSLGA